MKTKMEKKNINRKEKINTFVEEMLNDTDLSKKDRQKVYGDYKKIINYYLKNNINEEEITRRLKNDQVSKCYKKNNDWYSLDNSSKIYPLSMSSEWMSTYRLSIYLKDKVIPEVLQIALFYTVIRFPLFRTNLHKGFFWHYLDSSNKYYKIVKEEDIPCSPINVSKREKELLKYLIAKGVPNHFRQNLWILCSGAKNDLLNNASYYNNLLKLSKEVPSLYEKQIDKDIRRTINENMQNYEQLKIKMKNILMCYSIRNSSIGYCQGFNFLVLRLLQVIKGEVIHYNFYKLYFNYHRKNHFGFFVI